MSHSSHQTSTAHISIQPRRSPLFCCSHTGLTLQVAPLSQQLLPAARTQHTQPQLPPAAAVPDGLADASPPHSARTRWCPCPAGLPQHQTSAPLQLQLLQRSLLGAHGAGRHSGHPDLAFLAFKLHVHRSACNVSSHWGGMCRPQTLRANPRAPPAAGTAPSVHSHTQNSQDSTATLQDSPTKQLPTVSPCSRITSTLALRQLPAGRLPDGSASSLPLSPTHFPLLFSLGELRATQTICHPSEHPPGSDGFRETGSEVSG